MVLQDPLWLHRSRKGLFLCSVAAAFVNERPVVMNVRHFTSTPGSWLVIHDGMLRRLERYAYGPDLLWQLTFNLWRLPNRLCVLSGTGFRTDISKRTGRTLAETRGYEDHFEQARQEDRPANPLPDPLLDIVGAGQGFIHDQRRPAEAQRLCRLLEDAQLYYNRDPRNTPFRLLRPRAHATQYWSLLLCLNFVQGKAIYLRASDALAGADWAAGHGLRVVPSMLKGIKANNITGCLKLKWIQAGEAVTILRGTPS